VTTLDPHAGTPAAAHSVPRRQPDAVGVLRWEDERHAAAVLARAFLDDPLVMAICPAEAAERRCRMWWGFRVSVRSHCLAQQPAWGVVDAAATLGAVVLVTRAHGSVSAASDLVFALRGLLHMGLGVGLRGSQAAQAIAAQAPAHPFTYLRTLGVDPALQGRGLGSTLVDWVVRTAPAALPIYLETAKERNLAFYARHGFACVGDFRCLGVPVWRLLRPPSDGSARLPGAGVSAR
jgi:GNAT superfamily N-acetyltransferase